MIAKPLQHQVHYLRVPNATCMGLKLSNNITYDQCGKSMTQCRKKEKKELEMCVFFIVVVANGWTFS
jgi:hypothetical protein